MVPHGVRVRGRERLSVSLRRNAPWMARSDALFESPPGGEGGGGRVRHGCRTRSVQGCIYSVRRTPRHPALTYRSHSPAIRESCSIPVDNVVHIREKLWIDFGPVSGGKVFPVRPMACNEENPISRTGFCFAQVLDRRREYPGINSTEGALLLLLLDICSCYTYIDNFITVIIRGLLNSGLKPCVTAKVSM